MPATSPSTRFFLLTAVWRVSVHTCSDEPFFAVDMVFSRSLHSHCLRRLRGLTPLSLVAGGEEEVEGARVSLPVYFRCLSDAYASDRYQWVYDGDAVDGDI